MLAKKSLQGKNKNLLHETVLVAREAKIKH